MSTHAIETEIAQISLEIERQKDVLRNLERSKSLLLRQLNAERDPIARLPLEISSEIFLQCLPTIRGHRRDHPRSRAPTAPLLLLHISHNWTDIALFTPALWASIDISFPRPRGFEELLEMWLRSAGSHPLQIFLRGAFDSLVAHPIQSHCAQIERLAISFDEPIDDEDELYDLLGEIQPQMELPGLQVLEIGDGKCFWLSVHRLLRISPNLTQLFMRNISFEGNINEEEPDTLILPHLRHLSHIDNFDAIDWISAPRLEILCISTESLFNSNFISFLGRSSAPLRKLQLFGESYVGRFEDSMALIPSLTHLEYWGGDAPFTEELLNFLEQHPHRIPNLETLHLDEIIVPAGRIASAADALTALAGVLSVRRTRLKMVRLGIYPSDMFSPDVTFFRELLEDGMDIHISFRGSGPNILSSS